MDTPFWLCTDAAFVVPTLTHSCERFTCTHVACAQNVEVIRTIVSLKIEIKEKFTFCGLTLYIKQL